MRKVKPYIILLIVISLILAGLTGCTKMSAQEVIYRASAATMEIESFHMTMTVTGPGDYIVSAEGDYMSPDRAHFATYEQGSKKYEMRRIGDNVYEWDYETGLWELLEGTHAEATLWSLQAQAKQVEPEKVAEMLEGLEHIEVLPDEVIDGVSCVHYRGSYDPFHLDALREQIENETDPDLKEMLQHILEVQEQLKEEMEMTAVAEVWIGKDDYLVRQKCVTQSWKMTDDEDINGTLFPVGTKVTFTGILKFSNFNEPVKIEVPL